MTNASRGATSARPEAASAPCRRVAGKRPPFPQAPMSLTNERQRTAPGWTPGKYVARIKGGDEAGKLLKGA